MPAWPLLAAALLVVLLATLGTLQYRWLGEVSQAERARMRESLQTRANDFAAEFDRALAQTFLAFQIDSDAFDRDAASTLHDVFTRAESSGATRIVKAVYLLEAESPAEPSLRQFDAAAGTLTPVAWPPELLRWRERVDRSAPGARSVPPMFLPDAIDAGTPVLVIPVPKLRRIEDQTHVAVLRDPIGVSRAVVVWLDAAAIRSQLLQPLYAKYFGPPDASDYAVAIVSRDDPGRLVFTAPATAADSRAADATAGLFDLRLDDLNRAAASVGMSIPRSRAGAATGDRATADKVAITIVRRGTAGDQARTLLAGPRSGAWELRARHLSGSLDAIVAQSRRRNLAIGLGVLALLGGSFVLIIAAAQRQQRLARQQMEFVAAVSHELRTPLAVICSAGENLSDGVVADPQQVKRYGSLIETEGRRLGDMVERVLQFAGISSGAGSRVRGAVDLGGIIADAARAAAIEGAERGVTVTVHPGPPLPPTMGDASALRSAVQNVIGNAVKYSRQDGVVDVTTELSGDRIVRIRVADDGIGIDAADLPHIFEPFYRGRRAIDAQVRGTGIGLAVVRQVVRSHGGDVDVDSRADEGTAVTIVLPLTASPDPAESVVVRIRQGAAS